MFEDRAMMHGHRPRRRSLLAAGVVAAGIIAAAVYVTATEFLASRVDPAASVLTADGEPNARAGLGFSFLDQPHPLPDIRFVDSDGRGRSLADFRGRPLLLNLWATWCAPCRKEIPSLDRLQAKIGRDRLLVVPLSIDRQGLPAVKGFYDELGLTALGMYVDSSAEAAHELHAFGIPTTLLIDREGREIGRKIGEAEWDSPDTIALIQRHLPPLAPSQGQR